MRASSRREHDPAHRDQVLRDVEVIDLDPAIAGVAAAIAGVAAAIAPSAIRTLDAIHLATALALMPELDAFVTYDDRLADAARALGLPVVRPG